MVLEAPSMQQLFPGQEKSIYSIIITTRSKSSEFYCEAAKTILQNDEVLMILLYFETTEAAKYYLKEAGVDIDFYRKTDSLFVIDSWSNSLALPWKTRCASSSC